MHRCFTIPKIFHQQRDKAPLSFLAKWNCKTHTHAPLCPSPEAKKYTEIPRDIHLTQDYEIILVTGFPEKKVCPGSGTMNFLTGIWSYLYPLILRTTRGNVFVLLNLQSNPALPVDGHRGHSLYAAG